LQVKLTMQAKNPSIFSISKDFFAFAGFVIGLKPAEMPVLYFHNMNCEQK